MKLRFSPDTHGLAECVKHFFSLTRRACATPRLWGPLLMLPCLLTGCAGHYDSRHSSMLSSAAPKSPAPDLYAAECGHLWETRADGELHDANYWLRAMECAERMTPSQARLAAENQGGGRYLG
ncbi:hypothetical protein ABK905_19820 [Acerihabitans sp. KWT182]|uniref:Uncharacterized protein n=1 Tax=Acerihabitans sp. KWT182 TaxID=3157919 RepID=A0AAU7Q716_9GAMM